MEFRSGRAEPSLGASRRPGRTSLRRDALLSRRSGGFRLARLLVALAVVSVVGVLFAGSALGDASNLGAGSSKPLATAFARTATPLSVGPEVGFSIEKLQEIQGSGGPFTTAELTGKVGQTVDYEIIVTNTGFAPLAFSEFTDVGCEGIAGGSSNVLERGESTTYTCSHLLSKADEEAGGHCNSATITGAVPDQVAAANGFSETSNTVCVAVPAEPSFSIEKLQQINGSGGPFTTAELTAKVGQTVDYEVIVTNTGNTSLEFGPLADKNCGGIAGGPGEATLEPGESTMYTCSYQLTKADEEAGGHCNRAAITGGVPSENDGDTLADAAPNGITEISNTVCVTVPAEPSFSIEKLQEIEGSGGSFTTAELTGKVGQTVDYEIIVTNTGNTSLEFSEFEDAKCGGIEGGPSGALEPGESTTYTCSHTLTKADQQAGRHENHATVTGSPPNEEGDAVETAADAITKTSNTVVVLVPTPVCPNAFSGTGEGVNLGSAGDYAVLGLAGTRVNNSIVTVTGNEGVSQGGSLMNRSLSTL